MDLGKINKAYWLEGGREKIKELEAIRDEKIQEELDNIRLKNKLFRTSSDDIYIEIISEVICHYEWLYERVFNRKVSYERLAKKVLIQAQISIRSGNDTFGYGRTDPMSVRLFGGNGEEKSWLKFFKKTPTKYWGSVFKFFLFDLAIKNGVIYFNPSVESFTRKVDSPFKIFKVDTPSNEEVDKLELIDAEVNPSDRYYYPSYVLNIKDTSSDFNFLPTFKDASLKLSLWGVDYISCKYENAEYNLGISYRDEFEKQKAENERRQKQFAEDELKRLEYLEVKKQKEREEKERKKQEELERPFREENELLKQQLFELNENLNFLTRRIDRNKNDIQKTTKDLKKIADYLAEKKEAYNRISYREKKIFEEFDK